MERLVINTLVLLAIALSVVSHTFAQSNTQYQVEAADGAWCWFSDPRAVYHKGAHEKIYYSYINSQGDVVISARDLKKSSGVQTFVLHEKLQIDDHNVPSILFLPDGKILTFYTEHNGRFFMRKSLRPEDISAWEEERTISFGLADRMFCYSHPAMLSEEDNRIYMFFRAVTPRVSHTGWGQYYSYSDDQGTTWTKGTYLLDTKAINNPPYLKVNSDSKSRIDILFTDGHPKIGPASVYHMYYEKGKFHRTDGEDIASLADAPLQLSNISKVYDASSKNTRSWIWDIAVDKKGRPVVAYAQYPSVKDHIYHYAYWDGKRWIDEELINSGSYITSPEKSGKVLEEHYSGGIVLDHHNPKNVFLSRQKDGVFEIEQWQLKGNKWKSKSITERSTSSNIRPYVVADYPGADPMVMWMSGTYEHYVRYKTALMIYKP